MNNTPNQPQNSGRGRRRRKGGRRGPQAGQGTPNPGQGGQHNGQGGPPSDGQKRFGRKSRTQTFVGPMDHSYRTNGVGNGNGNGMNSQSNFSGRADYSLQPLVIREDAPVRIYAFVDDLFFLAKIQETARKINVKVQFVKTDKDLIDHVAANHPEEKPSLIIFDLNNISTKPLSMITRLKSKFKRETSIVGFLSHVQGELKVKAQEAGCDVVMPRSAFSQTLPQMLRRHGALEEVDQTDEQPGM